MKHVIFSQTKGVYLGFCLGLFFWSLLDPVGQDAAVVFESEADAEGFLREIGHNSDDISFIQVNADIDDGRFASIASCVAAGIPAWEA